MGEKISFDLAREIQTQCGENVFLCYQCQKCSSGCPVAEHFDLAPNQLMRALQLGQRETVLRSKTLWLCAMCETCAVRCPHDINITRVMDTLKILAQKEGLLSPLPPAVVFNRAALREIRWFGRMYEAGLMGELYLRQMKAGTFQTRQFLNNDFPLALRMIRKRKLKLLPSRGNPRITYRNEEQRDEVAYYPGCSLHGTSREYNASTVAVLKKLGIKFSEPEGWSCCGSTPAHSTDHYLSVRLPVKNIIAMQEKGFRSITTPCPSCFLRLRSGLRECEDEGMKRQLLADIHKLPDQDTRVDHLLRTIVSRVGYDTIARAVVKPLSGLKVVCYYGCIITRPPRITGVKDFEYPHEMDRIMTSIGAVSLDWSYKTRCCGGSLGISQLPIALDLTRKILFNAKRVGADAVVVACPLCQVNLDARQKQISDEGNEEVNLPIIYFTQLMGLAFGMSVDAMELDKHFIDSSALTRTYQETEHNQL